MRAKLSFFYSVMNAGKSSSLLQAAHNYKSLGWNVLYFTSAIDTRDGKGYISSRIGLKQIAVPIGPSDTIEEYLPKNLDKTVIFVDEVQFFEPHHIKELSDLVDIEEVPVLCYGLKNNSNGELFGPAIIALLAEADQIKELKTVCNCGSKATQILRYKDGYPVFNTDVVEVGNSEYKSVCRFCWKIALIDEACRETEEDFKCFYGLD